MLTQDEEQRIRDTVRRGLEQILGEPAHAGGEPAAGGSKDVERIADAKRIIAEETERYYKKLGLVKHVSRSSQVFWVTPAEEARLRRRRGGQRHRFHLRWDRKVVLVWGASILVAVLLVIYLLSTQVMTTLMH